MTEKATYIYEWWQLIRPTEHQRVPFDTKEEMYSYLDDVRAQFSKELGYELRKEDAQWGKVEVLERKT